MLRCIFTNQFLISVPLYFNIRQQSYRKSMVKKLIEDLRKEQIFHEDKLIQKAEELVLYRKRDFLRDIKRAAIKNNREYKKRSIKIYDHLYSTSLLSIPENLPKQQQQVQKEVFCYKIAKQNTEKILNQFEEEKVKNERPPDYLVQMYKSDKQMMKVRRNLTEKQEKIKQKLQGRDWMSKNKKRERAKKKAQSKKQRKKGKIDAKRPKIKMDKIKGKNKVKK